MSDGPLTVFHINGERGLRGGERQLLGLASHLRRSGHKNIIACRKEGDLYRAARRQGFETMALPFLSEWDPVSSWRLRRRAREFRAPLFHAHTSHGAALACLAAEGSRVPRVVHRRVDFPVSQGPGTTLKYARAQRVIAVSEAIRRQCLEAGLAPGQVVTIHDGVPAELIRPEARGAEEIETLRRELAGSWGIDPRGKWLGNLAALVPHKDHSNLLKAMAEVAAASPEAVLLIGGEGPLDAALQDEARQLGLGPRVRFLGQVEDPVSFLDALDVFILSSWGEGFGSVLLEAMARGLPIVATRAGGMPEALTAEENGLLVPPRDPGGLATAVLRVLQDPALSERLAERALVRARSFTVRIMGEKTEAVYREASA